MAASSGQHIDLFYSCVKHLFTNWTALKYAVQMGMGGAESQAKAHWMVDVIVQYFRENDDLLAYEVEDLLNDVLNNEFNLIADDGSVTEVSQKLCQFFRLQSQNKDEELLTFLNAIPSAKGNEVQTVSRLEDSLQELHLGTTEKPPEMQETKEQQPEIPESMETANGDEDGEWQTITRGRKK